MDESRSKAMGNPNTKANAENCKTTNKMENGYSNARVMPDIFKTKNY